MAVVAHAVPMSMALQLFSEGSSGGVSVPPVRAAGQGTAGSTPSTSEIKTKSPPRSSSNQRISSSSHRTVNRSYKRAAEEEDKLKRSRAWANAYELSQDLHDKQVEMLERKYGGHIRANHAAKVIQQGYRHYCMNKNFAKLRTECGEKRLSRRLEFGRSKTIWSDMVVNVEKEMGLMGAHHRHSAAEQTFTASHSHQTIHQQHQSGADVAAQTSGSLSQHHTHHHSSSSYYSRSSMTKSHSHNAALGTSAKDATGSGLQGFRSKPLQRTMGLDLSTIDERTMAHNIVQNVLTGATGGGGNVRVLDVKMIKKGAKKAGSPPGSEANNNRLSHPELNDSSASDSPQDTPVEPHVDLPSVNFENLLETRETDILNDSFHSDSSQDGNKEPQTVAEIMSPSYSRQEHMDSVEDLLEMSNRRENNVPGMAYEQVDYDSDGSTLVRNHLGGSSQSGGSEVHICFADTEDESDMDTLTRGQCNGQYTDFDRTPTQQDGQDTLTRIYCDTEVRLRPKKASVTGAVPPNNTPTMSAGASSGQQHLHPGGHHTVEASPIWKRKSAALGPKASGSSEDVKRMSNISENSEQGSIQSDGMDARSLGGSSISDRYSQESPHNGSDTASMSSHEGHSYSRSAGVSVDNVQHQLTHTPPHPSIHPNFAPKMTDRQRKRAYRIGLNLFNKKPEKGIKFLMERRFLDQSPAAVARFLIARKGLSKQMIGEYLGNLQKPFNMEVLNYFSEDIDLTGLDIDVALRKFQAYFRMPGEAQKIERLMEAFAHRFCIDNPESVRLFQSPDTVFLLSFAIIMLNTDLHNQSVKAERKMKLTDFIKNLRGLDAGQDIDAVLLEGIYGRIKDCEFKHGNDHVAQVMKVEQMIVGKKPTSMNLALPHRRLVCFCRLYEVHDPNRKEKIGLHQREVFLFNDLLLITKIFSKKKNHVQYSFRQSYSLCGMLVYLFETPHYQYGIRLTTNIDGKVLITFNARNEHDRTKFVEDLKEAILEMNEMEALRIDEELHKQRMAQTCMHGHHAPNFNRHSKDSGVVDIDLLKASDHGANRLSAPECEGMKKNTLSNSLCDLSEVARRGSGGSLDSGMASTSSACSVRDDTAVPSTSNYVSEQTSKDHNRSNGPTKYGLFLKKSKNSKSSLLNDSSEV